MALPTLPPTVTDDLASFVGACAVAIRDHYATPGGAAAGALGLLVAGSVVARAWYSFTRALWSVRRVRRRQRDVIELVARNDVVPGAWVLDDTRPAVYCIPGARPTIVLTAAAVGTLSARQRQAVLAHESAHLKGRHDMALTGAKALRDAFSFVTFFRIAAAEIESLIEMHADDHALRAGGQLDLATALVRLAEGPTPTCALAANGAAAVERVQRLLDETPEVTRLPRLVIKAGIAVTLVLPLLIATGPAVEVALLDYCPIILHR